MKNESIRFIPPCAVYSVKYLIISLLLLVVGTVSAQVTSVNYQLKYDTTLCQYDAYLIINAGSATTIPQRIQFNAQYSIIVPTGTSISVTESYLPLQNNATYTGTTPLTWAAGTPVIAPAAQSESDFYSITPDLGITSHYNNLSAGDTIKLFSFELGSIVNCSSGVRIFENGVDPSSDQPGMGFQDYTNGFTLGSISQIYSANSAQQYPPSPEIVSIVNTCSTGVNIDLTAETSTCQTPLSYSWTGPNSYSSTTEDVNIPSALPANNGVYIVVITDAFGCKDSVTIDGTSKPDAGPDATICAGETIILSGISPTTGTWAQSSVNPFGLSLSPLPGGQVSASVSTFATVSSYDLIYSIPSCSDTMTLYANPAPLVNIEASQICENGQTLAASNIPGGTWVSNTPAVATIDANSGVITGVNSGVATFTFTAPTGCTAMTNSLTVNPGPIVSVSGADDICVGGTTFVTPNIGGTWTSTEFAVATVTNTGVVTGISAGTTTLIFTDTFTGCSSDSLFIDVTALPVATFVGSDSICVNGTTSLTPAAGGTWVSSNPIVASIDNSGNVTGNMVGTAVFTYTDVSTGCTSLPSDTLWVLDDPTVAFVGDDRICKGETSSVSPNTGGTWVSNNVGVATIIATTGIITGVAQGAVTFTFTDATTGCTATTTGLIVDPNPTISTDSDYICITSTALLSPSVGGTWMALNPGIASLVGNEVTGVASGDAGFIFTADATGCVSDTLYINVDAGPSTNLTGPNQICYGSTTTIEPSSGGTWSSSDNTVATIDNFGLITGVGAGVVQFTFTSATSLCASVLSEPVQVIPAPIVSTPSTDLCITETMNLTPAFGGTWVTSDPGVATVNAFTGLVTAVFAGEVTFTFIDAVSGCSATSSIVTVHEVPAVEFSAPNTICVGFTTTITPNSGGTWVSSAPGVAVIDNGGTVTGISAGTANLTYTDTNTGCASEALTVTVLATPEVSLIGDDEICIGETTTLSPATGGVWISSNPSVASVNNTGLVTALSPGQVTCSFVTNDGSCATEETPIITVSECITTSCEDINPSAIFCDYTELDAVEGSLLPEDSEGNQPLGVLCDSEVGNIQWLGFFALEGTYEIIVNTSSCVPMVAGDVPGVQVGIYSSCDFSDDNMLYCEYGTLLENQIVISSDLFTAGEIYYMYIDGLDNSTCDFSIDVVGNYDNTFCTDLSKVTGTAFMDSNENGIFDMGETPLRNVMVSLFPGNFSVLTNDEGKYIINTPVGGATLTAKINEGSWINDELIIENVEIFEACVEDINFGFVSNEMNQEAKVSISNTVTRCDWETRFYFTVENTGALEINPSLEFEFDDMASYFSTNQIGLQVNGNIANTTMSVMQPFEVREFWITLKMPSGSSVLPILDFKTSLYNGSGQVMDEYEHSEQLKCSYDPNDKREYPNREGEENLTLMDEELEYTIRFQNNGNDTAFLVKIIDPLDANIDPTSIRVINSSHAVETCIENENLIFMFEDINLVDSMTNYEGSQGYVSFRCNTKEGRAENTIVHNTADIIFDTNSPIVTNTTINTLVSELCTNVTSEIDIEICDGEEYNGLNESGTYTEVYPLLFGCDSIVLINLDVQGITYSAQDITVCEGDNFEVNGNVYTLYESQEIRDTSINAMGCITDVFIFDVLVNPIQQINIDTTICEGLEYEGLTESGIYMITSFDIDTGCDINTTIDLEVLPMNDPACIVGTEELTDVDVKIYPNPATNVVFIEGQYNINTISIYSMNFQKLKELTFDNIGKKQQLSTVDLNVGIYIIEVHSKEKVFYKKLIKE